MFILSFIYGLILFALSYALWDRAKRQPEDTPMRDYYGLQISKGDVYIGAIIVLFLGVIAFMTGFLV